MTAQPSETEAQRDADWEQRVRHVKGFPAPGVVFQDLTPVLAHGPSFRSVIESLAASATEMGADLIAGLDARGFLLGSAVAYSLDLGVLAVRKKGKLPPPVYTEEYTLEYGTAALEIPAEAMNLEGKRVVLVDDVLATGGTLNAATRLLQRAGATVTGAVVILEVPGLGGREALGDLPLAILHQPRD